MNKLVRCCFLPAALLVVLAGGAGTEEQSLVASHPMIGEAAPPFDLSTTEGDSLGLADLEGKYLVVHFGASW